MAFENDGADDIDGDLDLEPARPGNQAQDRQPADDDAPEGDDIDREGGEPDPELIDYEDDKGNKLKVPKALKDHLLRQSDYSRRMNDLKTQRDVVEAEKANTAAWRTADKEHRQAVGALAQVEATLAEYEKVNFPAWLAHANPNERARAQQAMAHMQQLERAKGKLNDTITEATQKAETEAKQATAERLRATREYAEKEIPGWTPELDGDITHYAMQNGISRDQLLSLMSPQVYRVLHDALTGARYRAARAKAKATAKAETTNVEPLTRVGTRRSNTSSAAVTDRVPIGDWMKRRNAQVRKAR